MNNIWDSLNRSVLIVTYKSISQLTAFSKALITAGLVSDNYKIVAVVEDKKQLETLSSNTDFVFFHEKEINFFGRNKNEKMNKLLSNQFDLQIVVGDSSKKMAKQIAQMKVKFRIGLNTKQGFYDINLHSEDHSPAHLINFAKTITEKLS